MDIVTLQAERKKFRFLTDQAKAEEAQKRLIELRTNTLLGFTTATKPDYEVNWHHRLLCSYLDKFVAGEIKRLMVFMPPRVGKSELVSRRLPAYIFGRDPRHAILGASYGDSLASRMNRDIQRIIDEPNYNALFPNTQLYGKNIRTVARGAWLRNNDIFEIVGHGGVYRSAGIGGGITGMGFNTAIIDDPIKSAKDADSKKFRDNLWDWYVSTLYTRLEKDGKILLTLTRWHEDDLAGRLLAAAKADPDVDQWTVLNFPMEREDLLNLEDPRELGAPLWPNKYSEKRCNAIKVSAGPRVWNSLFQQRPSPESGNIVQRDWFQFYEVMPSLDEFDTICTSWDLTFTDETTSDYVAGGVFGRKGADIYLLDLIHGRMSFTASIEAILSTAKKWPRATAHYVEKAANGAAALDVLKAKISGLLPVNPRTSKIARAQAVSPMIQSKNYHIPHPSLASYSMAYIEEWVAFPNAKNDDRVDMTTQALLKLREQPTFDIAPVSLTKNSLWR